MTDEKSDCEIISKEEKFWIEFKERTEKTIFNLEKEIRINENLLNFAEKEIKMAEDETKTTDED